MSDLLNNKNVLININPPCGATDYYPEDICYYKIGYLINEIQYLNYMVM